MANPDKKMTVNFNVLLDPDTDGQLMRLADSTQLSKAHVVRSLIRRHFQMFFQRRPVCADGQDCRCPHAHIYPQDSPAAPMPPNPPGTNPL